MADAEAGLITLPPHLDHEALALAQRETLNTPRRPYGLPARVLFGLLDVLYRRKRTLSKFKVLELVARVPYQSWEQVAYIAITHVALRPVLARRIHDRVAQARVQQDNEQWHLLILEELVARTGKKESRLLYYWTPQSIAFVYHQLSWLLYVLHPAWSYQLNADFEDHPEHEYMTLVVQHPEWEEEPFTSAFEADYGSFESLADLSRQIATTSECTSRKAWPRCASPIPLRSIFGQGGGVPGFRLVRQDASPARMAAASAHMGGGDP